MDTIQRVHSHEQAIAQCRNNLIKNNKDMIVVADTAGAAKMVSEKNNKEDAAIASNLAAQIYNLEIVQSNFQDAENNVTRFLIMAKDNVESIPALNEIDIGSLVLGIMSTTAFSNNC